MGSRRCSDVSVPHHDVAMFVTALYVIVAPLLLQPVDGEADQPASGVVIEPSGVGTCVVRVADINPPVGALYAYLLQADSDGSVSGSSATRGLRVRGPELAFALDSIPYGAYTLRLVHDATGTPFDTGVESTASRDGAGVLDTEPATTGDALTWVTDFVLEDSVHQIEANMREASPRSATLTVTMTGFRNENGVAQVTLFNGSDGFPDKPDRALMHGSSPIVDAESQITFEQVPFGTYGVGVIHDENGNERMDTNFLGKPREGYGASNDARGRFGPPSFEDASFTVGEDTVSIAIAIAY
jgi:uncharacterized protein (DUF2141 family)